LGRLGGSNIHLIGAMNIAAQSTESGFVLFLSVFGYIS